MASISANVLEQYLKGVQDPVKLLFPLTSIHSAVKQKSFPKSKIQNILLTSLSLLYRIYKYKKLLKKHMANITLTGSISLQGCHFSKHSTNYPTFAQILSRMTE